MAGKVPIVASTIGTFPVTFLDKTKNFNGCLLFPLLPSL
jgi:hypothetical protein